MKVKFFLVESQLHGREVRPFCPKCADEIEVLGSYSPVAARRCCRCGALSEFPGYHYRDIHNGEDYGLIKLCNKCAELIEGKKDRHLDPWEPITEEHTCCEQCGRLLETED